MAFVFIILLTMQDEMDQGHHDLGLFGEGEFAGIFHALSDCVEQADRMELILSRIPASQVEVVGSFYINEVTWL